MYKYIKILFVILLGPSISLFGADFNILHFGAINDTNQLSTFAINGAIEAASKAGGGKVIIPNGNFKTGTITLLSNVELHLENGATLYLSTDHSDIPRQKQPAYRSQKDPGGWYAFIYAEGQHHISITGSGTIDGLGARQMPRPEALDGDRDGRPRNILFISCNNVTVTGINMLNSGIWMQHYLNCEDVIIDRIRVYNHCNRNNDGIDFDGCRRVVLSNSIIDSDDDAIVIKSTGPAACEDIVVTNCIVSSYTNGIKCGTESTGGFRNININNCIVKPTISKVPPVFGRTNIGITGVSLEIVDGGTMEGVNVNNIIIEKTEAPLYIRLAERSRKHKDEAPTPGYGTMKDIRISNITAYSAGNYTSSITGVPNAKIKNVSLSNIKFVNEGGVKKGDYLANYMDVKEDEKGYPEPTAWRNLPASGLFIRHVENIDISNLNIASKSIDPRTPIIAVDIDQLYLDHISTDVNRPTVLAKDVNKIIKEKSLKVRKIK